LAAQKASPEEIKRLERIVGEMEAASDDINSYFPLATSFHQELALSTKNQIFYIIWNLFQDILKKAYMPVLEEYFPEGPGKLLESNRVLLRAIESKDPRSIDKALAFHAQQEKDLVDAARKKVARTPKNKES
jgi:DNA-binding FadR family transcriptional regulator